MSKSVTKHCLNCGSKKTFENIAPRTYVCDNCKNAMKNESPSSSHYTFEFKVPVEHGHAILSIPAPDGKLSEQDAEYITFWFDSVAKQLKKMASN